MRAESSVDDVVLVGRTLAGDLVAYGELVRRYQFHALRVATGIAGVADGEDAAQDTFVRAFRALARFDPTQEFRPWLMVIVANTARNHRRSKWRWDRASVAGTRRTANLNVDAASAEEIAVDRSEDQLTRSLRALSRPQREVITCRYLMDLSEEETASVLNIPRGTVKSRLARALKRLEQSMPQELNPDD